MRGLVLALALLVGGCLYTSDRPLFFASDSVAPYRTGTIITAGTETYRLQRRGDAYFFVNEMRNVSVGHFIPIGQIARSPHPGDVMVQLSEDDGSAGYVFLLSTPTGWRFVSSPREAAARTRSDCPQAQQDDDCNFADRAALLRVYRNAYATIPASVRATLGEPTTIQQPEN